MNFIYYQINLLLFILLSTSLGAQHLDQQVISAQGNYVAAEEMSISWTIGENFIETGTADGLTLTQGFHQPQLQVEEVTAVSQTISSFPASIFPNPTLGSLSIITENTETEYRLEVYDALGRLVHTAERFEAMSQFDMSGFASGQYLLCLISPKSGQMSKFKVIKQ